MLQTAPLTSRLDVVVALDGLSAAEQRRVVREVCGWAAALRVRVLAGLPDDRATAASLSLEGGLSLAAAQNEVRRAHELAALPAVLAALTTGELGPGHAHALAGTLAPLVARDASLAADVAGAVCDQLADEPAATARVYAERAEAFLLRFDAAGEQERAEAAVALRGTSVVRHRDGTSTFAVRGAAADVDAADQVLTSLANDGERAPGDPTLGNRKADAFVHVLTGRHPHPDAYDSGDPAQASGGRLAVQRHVHVHVTVSEAALDGLTETAADLAGVGPVPVALARAAASAPGSTVHRVPVDRAGRLRIRDLPRCGARNRAPSPALRAWLCLRDRTCRFPGCPVSAYRCHADHVVPWSRGGPTVAENLVMLCAAHHLGVKHGGWSLSGDPNGDLVWTSPGGRRTVGRAPAICPEVLWGRSP